MVRQFQRDQPDPVLGYPLNSEGDNLWDKSLLKLILLTREQVWGETVKVPTAAAESSSSAEAAYTPTHYNFSLSPSHISTLTTTLPSVSALLPTLGFSPSSSSITTHRLSQSSLQELSKREKLLRIIDLKNASSKGIEVENTRRVVAEFGRFPGDTGSPEVQGLSPSSLLLHFFTTNAS